MTEGVLPSSAKLRPNGAQLGLIRRFRLCPAERIEELTMAEAEALVDGFMNSPVDAVRLDGLMMAGLRRHGEKSVTNAEALARYRSLMDGPVDVSMADRLERAGFEVDENTTMRDAKRMWNEYLDRPVGVFRMERAIREGFADENEILTNREYSNRLRMREAERARERTAEPETPDRPEQETEVFYDGL